MQLGKMNSKSYKLVIYIKHNQNLYDSLKNFLFKRTYNVYIIKYIFGYQKAHKE